MAEENPPSAIDPDHVPKTLCMGGFNIAVAPPIATITFTHRRPKAAELLDRDVVDLESVVRARIVLTLENLAGLRDVLNAILKELYPGEVGVCLQHLGILVGQEAFARIWPEIVGWIYAQQSDAGAHEPSRNGSAMDESCSRAADQRAGRLNSAISPTLVTMAGARGRESAKPEPPSAMRRGSEPR